MRVCRELLEVFLMVLKPQRLEKELNHMILLQTCLIGRCPIFSIRMAFEVTLIKCLFKPFTYFTIARHPSHSPIKTFLFVCNEKIS